MNGYEQTAFRDLTRIRESVESIAKSLSVIANKGGDETCEEIRLIMNGKEWDAETIERVAEIMRFHGYDVDEPVSAPSKRKGFAYHPPECSCHGGRIACLKNRSPREDEQ